ncbi:helix-turn-helix domain-containing protein [Bacillus atrophaeus]|uniref:BglII control element n=2 Tax=Bacillus subtilis group TaxID=653685 RepID=Q45487_BACIU|nr:helix-turn-helix transcriptional regulator [Bacillus atrophaeus]AAC45059.1 BglII control element [Bacillus subtilis]AMR64578.1 transcriptional regulator [Bacillus subtilis subsp. globigii]ADP34532.1 transcriptional regulator, XRE family protein [Bacillus atrophaeus 1942]AIK49052.1 C.AhdI domain protein [Bacillus atrophaeus subsp. globigii]EIM11426.1 XRE family transcriptional regulator [Bacillus atrophaeus C89]
MDIRERFGKTVSSIRRKQNLSQEKLAEISKLDRTYIGGVERGERNLSLLNIERLSNALQMEISEVFRLMEGDTHNED